MNTSGILKATATAAKSSGTVTATIGDTVVTVRVARDVSVAQNDVLLVTKVGADWWAIGRAYETAVTPPENPSAPPPKPPQTGGSLIVTPVETRSYRPNFGWRSDNTDVYQGEYNAGNHTGSVFYGGKPRSLAGATVVSARIRVRRERGGVFAPQATTMRLMTNSVRPAGAPTLTSSTSGPSLAVGATNDGFGLPVAWAQAMVDGTAGGIAFFDADGSPYVRFAGRGTWSPAFTMTIRWQR